MLALGVGALAALMLTGRLHAQPGAAGVKVAVVNVGMVFHKYEKAQAFKGKMEKVLEPFRQQAEPIRKQMVDWSEAMKSKGFDPSKREQYERGILDCKRKLEDIERDARKAIGKEQEDQIVTLFKEVAGFVQSYAKSNGIHLVVAYGESFEGDLFSFTNVNRKMQGMDLGGTTPLYVGPGVDISLPIADSLNNWYRSVTAQGGGVQPAGAKK
jgi:Skp family chaperone for outer membrane proteins